MPTGEKAGLKPREKKEEKKVEEKSPEENWQTKLNAFVEAAQRAATDPERFEKAKREFEEANTARFGSSQQESREEKKYVRISPEELRRIGAEADRMVAEKERERPISRREFLGLPKEPLAPETAPEKAPEEQVPGPMDSMREAERMGDTSKPGFWDRAAINMEAGIHEVGRWWSRVLAKRAEDKLAYQEAKIKELEEKSDAMEKRSWVGTAFSPIWYGPRIAWHYRRHGKLNETYKRHKNNGAVHEHARKELLNTMAARMDGALITHQERVKKLDTAVKRLDETLDQINAELRKLHTEIATTFDSSAKERLKQKRAKLEADLVMAGELRTRYEKAVARESEKATHVERLKSDILKARLPEKGSGAKVDARAESQKRVMQRMQRIAQTET